VYLILKGDVAVTKIRPKQFTKENMEEKILAVLGRGISFGELAVLYSTKRYKKSLKYQDCELCANFRNIHNFTKIWSFSRRARRARSEHESAED
jgi:CRP-like cAMP-binding protein